jgi:hypothetical protein
VRLAYGDGVFDSNSGRFAGALKVPSSPNCTLSIGNRAIHPKKPYLIIEVIR